MARVTKTRPPRHPNYAAQAAQQAGAAYNPQIAGERRDLHGQVASLNSMGSALQGALTLARRNIRGAGLQGDDLALALKELAYRSADVGAGTQLQIQTARQDTRGEVQGLLAQRGAAQQSALAEMQAAARAREQELADEARHRQQDFVDSLRLEEAKRNRGLGQYAPDDDDGGGGMSDSERQSHDAARFYSKQAFDALRASGKVDEDPREWDDATWDAVVGGVHQQKGVDSETDAARAVNAIRDHFGGGGVTGFDGGGDDGPGWEANLVGLLAHLQRQVNAYKRR